MAPRLRSCAWRGLARGAWLALGLWLALAGLASACAGRPWERSGLPDSLTQAAAAAGIVAAWYDAPTTRYAHAVLGDGIEAGALVVQVRAAPECVILRIDLPQDEVFEDLAPRLADVDGDGVLDVVVVQSAARLGAKLAIYGLTPDGAGLALYGATPNIGRANRWLAPIGAADLDGDGRIEIAYIDRPHLARTLRVWRIRPVAPARVEMTEIAALAGLTNHRIGEPFISSGLRDCGTGPELITADANWQQVMASALTSDGRLQARALAPWSAQALSDALACRR